MYFASVYLIWASRNPTGVAVLDRDSYLVHVGTVRDDAEWLAALRPHGTGDYLGALDAPLTVANRTANKQSKPHSIVTSAGSAPTRTLPTPANPNSPTSRAERG